MTVTFCRCRGGLAEIWRWWGTQLKWFNQLVHFRVSDTKARRNTGQFLISEGCFHVNTFLEHVTVCSNQLRWSRTCWWLNTDEKFWIYHAWPKHHTHTKKKLLKNIMRILRSDGCIAKTFRLPWFLQMYCNKLTQNTHTHDAVVSKDIF